MSNGQTTQARTLVQGHPAQGSDKNRTAELPLSYEMFPVHFSLRVKSC